MTKRAKSIMAGAIVFFIYSCFRNQIPLHNVTFFAAGCAIFLAVTFGMELLLPENGKLPAIAEKGIAVLAPFLAVLYLILYYLNEQDAPDPLNAAKMPRWTMKMPLWMMMILFGTAICLWILGKNVKEKKKWQRILRIVVSLLFTVAVSVQFYAPNVLLDTLGNIFHSHSYTNSILNVLWLTPYSHSMTTNYGHYGILYMPFVKALHRFFQIDYLTGIYLVTAVIAGISILAFIYVLNYFAKSDLVFYLAMFGIGEYYFMLMKGGVYLQVHPHRMIFPALILAFTLFEQKKGKHFTILEILLLTLSMVWSTEIGIVLLLSVTLYRWFERINDGNQMTLKKGFSAIREILLYAVLPFGLAYLIVEIYNVAVGGKWLNFADYMFPLISEKDYISYIELPLSNALHAWMGTGILFMSVVMLVILPMFFPEKKIRDQGYLLLLTIMGLGEMQYYINRPAEGCMFIVMFHVLILLALIFEKGQQAYQEYQSLGKEEKKAFLWQKNGIVYLAFRAIAVLLLFVAASDSLICMPDAYRTSANSIWKRKDLQEFAQYIWVQVPPDAPAFGMGVPEILAMVDRDPHLHTTDYAYPNMAFDVLLDVRNDMEDEQWFFCLMQSLQEMQMNYPGLTDHFDLHEVFQYGDYQFGFWTKKAEE